MSGPRLTRRLLLGFICAFAPGCYDSHPPSLLDGVPEEWLASPAEHADALVEWLCVRSTAARARLRCPESCWAGNRCDGLTPDEMVRNCTSNATRAIEPGCTQEWLTLFECTQTTILDTCEANPTTWPCFDEEEAMWDCIYR